MRISIARYRLLFRHPFGTAHGMRDGTDSVFVRIGRNGVTGYGEATMPPYMEEDQDSVVQAIRSINAKDYVNQLAGCFPDGLGQDPLRDRPAARTALTTACFDLISKEKNTSVASLFQAPAGGFARAMVTLGHGRTEDVPRRIGELPMSAMLKVKVGGTDDEAMLRTIMEVDQRPLFLDANQGWGSVAEAVRMVELCGEERLGGIEQPFPKDRWDLHQELRELTKVPVYADESIQGPADLERATGTFSGVNIKLMKCGGLDVAHRMAVRAHGLGLKVMLGSMSESSLGCAAMAQLRGMADLLDLDGPWLIRNDPFEGLAMENGELVVMGDLGVGVTLRAELDWNQFGA